MENETSNSELTSTMGNLVSTNSDEKSGEICDSTPTSSTDAPTASSSTAIGAFEPRLTAERGVLPVFCGPAVEDPISSTSSELADAKPSSSRAAEPDDGKTENVDDLVSDLETLLGEPTSSIDFLLKAGDAKRATPPNDSVISKVDEEFNLDVELEAPAVLRPKAEEKGPKSEELVQINEEASVELVGDAIVALEAEEEVQKPAGIDDLMEVDNTDNCNEIEARSHKEADLQVEKMEVDKIEEKVDDKPILNEGNLETIKEPEEKMEVLDEIKEPEAIIEIRPQVQEPISEHEDVKEPKVFLEIKPEVKETISKKEEIKEPELIVDVKSQITSEEIKEPEPIVEIKPQVEETSEEMREPEPIIEIKPQTEKISNEIRDEEPVIEIKLQLEETSEEMREPEPIFEIRPQVEEPISGEEEIKGPELIIEVKAQIKEKSSEEMKEPEPVIEIRPQVVKTSEDIKEPVRIIEIEPVEETSSKEIKKTDLIIEIKPHESIGAVESAFKEPKLADQSMEIDEIASTPTSSPSKDTKSPEFVLEMVEKSSETISEHETSTSTILSEKDMSFDAPFLDTLVNRVKESEKRADTPKRLSEIFQFKSSDEPTAAESKKNDFIDANSEKTVEEQESATVSAPTLESDAFVSNPELYPARESDFETSAAVSSISVLDPTSDAFIEAKLPDERIEVDEAHPDFRLGAPKSPQTPQPAVSHPKRSILCEKLTEPLPKMSEMLKAALEKTKTADQPPQRVQEVERQPKRDKLEPLLINVGETVDKERCYSPKITIKSIRPPEVDESAKAPLKMTITKQSNTMHSILKIYSPNDEQPPSMDEPIPKLIIKNVSEPSNSPKHSPKMGRSAKVFSPGGGQRAGSPRITIKPIKVPDGEKHSPKLTIKPILLPDEVEQAACSPRIIIKPIVKPISPKITIKPVVKPIDEPERIVLKINKGNIQKPEEEKLAKIKLKFSKEGGHAHIVQSEAQYSKLKEMLSTQPVTEPITIEDDDELGFFDESRTQKSSPITISEESNQEASFHPPASAAVVEVAAEAPPPPVVTPRKRGRPRKVPLEVREDFKEEERATPESARPKRSCRGQQSVRATLGIKARKPRGPGRGRGGKRGGGREGGTPGRPPKDRKLSAKIKQITAASLISLSDFGGSSSDYYRPPFLAPHESSADRADILMYEEETRMSADTSSRAHTPAKQVIPTIDLLDESQSSTTESAKRKPKVELPSPEGAVISADQLAEYYWSNGGPYMLQEQVAQFLGIKSFKRKYPTIPRRVVDMQERDFIRESGLACESMCDLGLTAVNSADILDIMYSDFQDKYEAYCKHQRDREAKELTCKQKALTLAASQERNKMDITQQAVQSAAGWNAGFNRARREGRRACMDLQTLTVHYPRGRGKEGVGGEVGGDVGVGGGLGKLYGGLAGVGGEGGMGAYPVALVPGQFADWYGSWSVNELGGLPLNTVVGEREVATEESGSESDSSSSESGSSFSGSSDEDCTLCKGGGKRVAV